MSDHATAEHFDVLVIKVWRETDAQHPFRARVTYGREIDDAPSTVVTTDPDEVVNTVQRWLAAMSAPDTDY
jgi:hypothetical protein